MAPEGSVSRMEYQIEGRPAGERAEIRRPPRGQPLFDVSRGREVQGFNINYIIFVILL
jgi:hypothetical protein